MEWLEAMKEAVNYMEAHLMENITAEDIAAHINLSPFYFQKGFKIGEKVVRFAMVQVAN